MIEPPYRLCNMQLYIIPFNTLKLRQPRSCPAPKALYPICSNFETTNIPSELHLAMVHEHMLKPYIR